MEQDGGGCPSSLPVSLCDGMEQPEARPPSNQRRGGCISHAVKTPSEIPPAGELQDKNPPVMALGTCWVRGLTSTLQEHGGRAGCMGPLLTPGQKGSIAAAGLL